MIKSKVTQRSGIDLAPMVDIVFILVTYFLLNASIIKQPAIEVKLPSSLMAKAMKPESQQIFIDAALSVYLNGKQVALDALAGKLKDDSFGNFTPEKKQKKKAVIFADKKVTYDFLIQVMDQLHEAKIDDYKLATDF